MPVPRTRPSSRFRHLSHCLRISSHSSHLCHHLIQELEQPRQMPARPRPRCRYRFRPRPPRPRPILRPRPTPRIIKITPSIIGDRFSMFSQFFLPSLHCELCLIQHSSFSHFFHRPLQDKDLDQDLDQDLDHHPNLELDKGIDPYLDLDLLQILNPDQDADIGAALFRIRFINDS
jgi:hypothetical protein